MTDNYQCNYCPQSYPTVGARLWCNKYRDYCWDIYEKCKHERNTKMKTVTYECYGCDVPCSISHPDEGGEEPEYCPYSNRPAKWVKQSGKKLNCKKPKEKR